MRADVFEREGSSPGGQVSATERKDRLFVEAFHVGDGEVRAVHHERKTNARPLVPSFLEFAEC